MAHPRVLVLENQRFQRSVLIKMLDHLGVRDVVQASNGEQALEQIQKSGGVDIVLCDLADRSLDCLGFLRSAARSGMLDTGELAGVEALARWEHPAKGLLLPADFLAAVMAYDLIDQMFKQLLEQGLNLLGVLRRQEVQLELSFNLHASQLISDQLVEHIQWALGQHDFPGNTLMFELAENGLLDISPRIQDNLLRLRMLGCGLSVDDFGLEASIN
eukprot:gene7160-11025_t